MNLTHSRCDISSRSFCAYKSCHWWSPPTDVTLIFLEHIQQVRISVLFTHHHIRCMYDLPSLPTQIMMPSLIIHAHTYQVDSLYTPSTLTFGIPCCITSLAHFAYFHFAYTLILPTPISPTKCHFAYSKIIYRLASVSRYT